MKNKLFKQLRQMNLMNDNNGKILETGLERLKSNILIFLFVLIVLTYMGNIVIGILFEINYSILRIYAGGYHAKTRNKCMILTYTSKILCLWVCFEVSIGDKIMRDLLCVVTTVIICIAPVENENRPLNKIEFIHFQLITKRITIIESCSVLCLIYFEKCLYAKTIMVAMCLNAVGIIAGKGLKNKENGLKNIYGGMYEKK